MTQPQAQTDFNDTSGVDVERTVAFFADRRAAPILLSDTVSELIRTLNVQRGLVDISSIPGLAIAEAFVNAGVPFESIEFGQERTYETLTGPDAVQNPVTEVDAERIRSQAVGEIQSSVGEIGSLNANLAIVPAVVGPNEKVLDLSPQTIAGIVLIQAEERGADLILIDAPERGFTMKPDGVYLRTVLHVQGSAADR